MDTKYWGPGGWILLHSISFAPNQDRKHLIAFFSTLPYVLPCKYCRASLSEYMKRYPLEDVDNEPHAFGKWLWKIHNCVNAKLRGQRLRVEPDPSFSEVKALYLEKAKATCTKTIFHGWEFLFSIIENHPYSKQSRVGKPIQGAPEDIEGLDPLEKNRWNMLSCDERLPYVLKFWKTLPSVLPFPEWKKIWNSCETDWSTRVSALKTLWSIRCRFERELELLNYTTFHSLCKELRAHRSGCSASKRAKTCRKKRVREVPKLG
jgi:hypothetical protein